MLSSSYLLTLVVVVVLGLSLRKSGRRDRNLPPGPPTLPLLGNLHVIPRKNAYLQFTKWARQYGGIFSLMVGSNAVIVISDPRVSRELIDRKSATTSDRPPSHFGDITSNGKNMGMARYTSEWRRGRRIMHDVLTKDACARNQPILHAEASQLMHDLLNQPEAFAEHARRFAVSTLTSILAGIRAPHATSALVIDFFDALDSFVMLIEPGAHPPVDLIPILKHMPARWAPWKRICNEVRTRQDKVYNTLLSACAKRIANDTRTGCYLEQVIEKRDTLGVDMEIIRGSCAALMEGGADTTSIFLRTLILLLVAFPNAQKKAQMEIDAVIGMKRAPVLQDFGNLPYVQALVKEVLRFRTIAPLGMPHGTTSDETFDGFVIPKGSTIFVNIWAMLHDPDAYEDPDTFRPERFLASKVGIKEGASDEGRREDLHFGGGRRICVGINMANDQMMLNTMNYLWGFNFKEAIDPKTNERIPVDINDFSEGILTHPNPFQCSITARSAVHADIIERQYSDMHTVLAQFEISDEGVFSTGSPSRTIS